VELAGNRKPQPIQRARIAVLLYVASKRRSRDATPQIGSKTIAKATIDGCG